MEAMFILLWEGEARVLKNRHDTICCHLPANLLRRHGRLPRYLLLYVHAVGCVIQAATYHRFGTNDQYTQVVTLGGRSTFHPTSSISL